jgi:hypothetical protein
MTRRKIAYMMKQKISVNMTVQYQKSFRALNALVKN